jgi:hypothetical protein
MRYGTVDRDFAMQLATHPEDQDGPVFMVNFMKYRPEADYVDGPDEPGEAVAPISGREADDRYAPVDVLRDIGAKVVFTGDVVGADGRPDPLWDRVGIVVYPTRRSFIAMQQREDFKEKHVHKDAGMEFTINMTAVAVDPVAGEGAGEIVTFVAWPEGSTPVAAPTEGALLGVEGRIIGDERRWSHLGVHFDPESAHRAADGAEGVMVVHTRPTIDRMRTAIDELARR